MNGVTCSRSYGRARFAPARSSAANVNTSVSSPSGYVGRTVIGRRSRRARVAAMPTTASTSTGIDQRAIAGDAHHDVGAMLARRLVVAIEHVLLAAAEHGVPSPLHVVRQRLVCAASDVATHDPSTARARDSRPSSSPIIGVPAIGRMTLSGSRVDPSGPARRRRSSRGRPSGRIDQVWIGRRQIGWRDSSTACRTE